MLLLLFARAHQGLRSQRRSLGLRRDEGVDADDRQRTGVLALFVAETLLLDPAPLVQALHRPEYAAALGESLELGEYRLLDGIGQPIDDVRAL